MRSERNVLTGAAAVAALAVLGAVWGCASNEPPPDADGGDQVAQGSVRASPDAGGGSFDDASALHADASSAAMPGQGASEAGAEAQDAGFVDLDAAADGGPTGPLLPVPDILPYAQAIVSFSPGPHAGFGADALPGIVLGAPMGLGTGGGSLDVLSLGVGGSIVLDFGGREIVDGKGADFIVFENPFWPGGDPKKVFTDLGQVSVSQDGKTWHTFACDKAGDGQGHFAGCAGWRPTLVYEPLKVYPLDQTLTGGDAFDLHALSLSRVRYVRIVDLSVAGAGNNAGFDLDAIGLVHFADPP